MLLVRHGDRPPDLRHVQVNHALHPVEDLFRGVEEEAVFRRSRDELMESAIQFRELGQDALVLESRRGFHDPAQGLQLFLADPLGGQPGRPPLDDAPKLEGLEDVLQTDGRNLIPAAVEGLDKPAPLKSGQSLPHRGLADPEPIGETSLQNDFARGQLGPDDLLLELGIDPLFERQGRARPRL